jgi:hypothetical protein
MRGFSGFSPRFMGSECLGKTLGFRQVSGQNCGFFPRKLGFWARNMRFSQTCAFSMIWGFPGCLPTFLGSASEKTPGFGQVSGEACGFWPIKMGVLGQKHAFFAVLCFF